MTAPAERTTVTARRDDRSTPWFDPPSPVTYC